MNDADDAALGDRTVLTEQDAMDADVCTCPLGLDVTDPRCEIHGQPERRVSAWPPLPGEMPGFPHHRYATCHPTRLAETPGHPWGSGSRPCAECAARDGAER